MAPIRPAGPLAASRVWDIMHVGHAASWVLYAPFLHTPETGDQHTFLTISVGCREYNHMVLHSCARKRLECCIALACWDSERAVRTNGASFA